MTIPTARKRLTTLLAGVAAAALLLTGCASTSPDPGAAPNAPTAGDDAFPVTIDTAYGEITVKEKPKRIVALSAWSDLELLNLLGEEPIAWGQYQTDEAQMLEEQPWMDGLYSGEPDITLSTAEFKPAVEAIAALEPDLILTQIYQTDEQTYEQLSAIAPTYVGIETDALTGWQDRTVSLAQLTGHDPAIVDQIEADLDAEFAAARERLPGLQGKNFYSTGTVEGGFAASAYGAEPMIALGLVPAEGQPATLAEAPSAKQFSWETIDEIDADVVSMLTLRADPSGETEEKVKADPRVIASPAMQNGTWRFSTISQSNAVNPGSPVTLRWWLNQIVPELEASALNQSGQ